VEAVRSSSARFEPGRWHTVLSVLRRALLARELSEAERRRIDDLLQQARVLVSGMAERAQAYQVLQVEEQSRRLAGISERLSTTVELRDLLEILAESLPELDVPSCHIALYEDPAHPAARARLVMAYGPPGQLTIEPEGRIFPSQDLAPRELLPTVRRYSLSVQPLYFREDQIGFAVIEATPEREEVYELLRGEISAALKRLQLLARNVELYREAVRGRVAAEEGRRLAEEANLLKSRFLATVSHELRTPLSLIVGASEMIARENDAGELPPNLVQDAESIRTSAQHLARLIGDVLDLASSQAGELRLVSEHLPMTEVLERAAALGAPMAREKGLRWRADIPPRLPFVLGDRTRLQQVVLNLVSNAVKFTEHGQISLWAELSKDEVLVAVTDSGMGIPLAEQEVIFDEFRRSERTASRGYGGMGLGLAISRRIVELHGGKIGVISTGADGAGSTFYFTLPIAEWPEEADARPDSRLDTVLLLTERAGRAEMLAQHLRSRGFQVETLVVFEGEDWLAQVVAAPPAAVVLDHEPATEGGWRTMQALKLNPGTSDVPVLFYSLFEGQNAGAMLALDYLPKPMGGRDLSAALQRQGIDFDARSSKTILIVDDEPGMVALHSRMVEASVPNCRILTAENGLQALAVMQQNRPDLVLLDLMMPEMDGFTVLQMMREAESTRSTPVIVLTAQLLTQADVARLQNGVTAVLGKGLFTAAEVMSQVELALTRSKRLGNEGQRLARAVMAYLHERFAEAIDREELARHFAVNERYLTRCFHQEMGIPPIAYLNRYRIRRACALLEAGSMNITDVALSTGFSDSAYFARVFQREMGVTPSAYRRGERAIHNQSA
jgi:signal transduction histidine kinase/DNA-binding response OmpR family regulator